MDCKLELGAKGNLPSLRCFLPVLYHSNMNDARTRPCVPRIAVCPSMPFSILAKCTWPLSSLHTLALSSISSQLRTRCALHHSRLPHVTPVPGSVSEILTIIAYAELDTCHCLFLSLLAEWGGMREGWVGSAPCCGPTVWDSTWLERGVLS